MLERRSDGVYRSTLLDTQPWLEHGFASRQAGEWPGDYVRVRQIHSAVILIADPEADPQEGDALVTDRKGTWIGIRTADCVPLLLADPERHCVAAVHAGWRGTSADIAGLAVKRLQQEFGSNPEDLLAAVGPCIGRCCFEVGAEVTEKFSPLFPEKIDSSHVDLAEANRRQLSMAGVLVRNIDSSGLCTVCDPVNFHSWRRDQEQSGRMAAAIRIR